MVKFLLASASPRRIELLKRLIYDFEVYSPDIDESFDPDKTIEENTLHIARLKGEKALSLFPEHVIISADTVIFHDNRVLGKPKDWEEAKRYLSKLQNDTHKVLTGLSIIYGKKHYSYLSVSHLTFAPITEEKIEKYLSSGEYADKAGAYAIQGDFSVYIDKINGDYTGIMGLPLSPLRKGLSELELI